MFKMKLNSDDNYQSAFAFMVLLFFMWGFITELDGALIPYLKGLFKLNNFQAALVQFAFFIAFVLVSMPSAWLLNKIGYRNGIVVGLLTMAVGSWLFYPASKLIYYPVFLGAIFVLASGVTLLQVAANPYVARLGSSETASVRLNLSQGINSLAKVLAPLFGSYFILRGLQGLSDTQKAEAVQMPYLFLGTVLFILAIVFMFVKLPEVIPSEAHQSKRKVPSSDLHGSPTSAWQFPQLKRGAMAIFVYVGAEVTIASFLVIYLSEEVFPTLASYQAMVADIPSADGKIDKFREIAARYLPFYWGGLMIGRLAGSYILQFVKANLLLAISAAACMGLMLLFLVSSGTMAMWALIGTGLFLSIMWSNIFTLAIDGLGRYTSQGSGILVAAIVGGALIPPIQGLIADSPIGLHVSFGITLFCFAYILYYGLVGYRHD